MKKFYDFVNDKNVFLKIIFTLIVSLLLSFLITNFNVLIKAKGRKVTSLMNNIQEISGFQYNGDSLVATDENPYIVICFGEDYKYINRYLFDYEYGDGFKFSADVKEKSPYGLEIESQSESSISNYIHLSENYTDSYINSIKLNFVGNNFRIKNIRVDNSIRFNKYNLIFTFIVVNLLFFLIFPGKHFKKIENKYLLIALSIGSVFLFCEPPIVGISYDEHVHFSNVYSLSFIGEKELTKSDNLMMNPTSFSFSDYNNFSEREEFEKQLEKSSHDNMGYSYKSSKIASNNLCYLPMAFVFGLTRAMNISYSLCLILSRLSNLLVYVICIYFAIKNTPIGKRILTVIGLFPTSLFLASHFSYDPTVTGFITLGLSLFLKEYFSNSNINSKNVFSSIIFLLFGIFPKIIYSPLLLLHLLYKKDKFNDNMQRKRFFASIVIIFLTSMSIMIIPVASGNVGSGDIRGGDTNSTLQLELVRNHPFVFVDVFKKEAINKFFSYSMSDQQFFSFAYIGRDTKLEYAKFFLLLMFFITISDNFSKHNFDLKFKLSYVFIYFLIYSCIFAGMYLSFTPVGANIIRGVQPRYFIPLLFLFLLTIRPKQMIIFDNEIKYDYVLCLVMSLILLGTLYDIVFQLFCF